MLSVILMILGVLIGVPILILVLFFLLPIRVGAGGFYREDDYYASGFVRAWAGLAGAVGQIDDQGFRLRVVIGPWTVWQPKEAEDLEDDEGSQTPDVETIEPAPQVSVASQREVPPQVEPPTASVELPDSDARIMQPVVESEPEPEPVQESDRKEAEPSVTPVVEAPQSSAGYDEVESKVEDSDEEVEKDPAWWSRLQVLQAQMKRYLNYVGDTRPILWRFVRRVLRVVGFRKVQVDLELGVGDPALMGRVFGYVEAFRRMAGKRVQVSLTPDFVRQRVAGSGEFEIAIYLYRLIWAVLALVGRGAILGAKVWWGERKAKQILAEA